MRSPFVFLIEPPGQTAFPDTAQIRIGDLSSNENRFFREPRFSLLICFWLRHVAITEAG
jgi:hypothetical protein